MAGSFFILTLLFSCYQNTKDIRETIVEKDADSIEQVRKIESVSVRIVNDTLTPAEQTIVEAPEIEIDDPVNVIRRIFTVYNEFQESTDLPSNLDSMTVALKQLENQIDSNDLSLIIDVWMYYTVTDFPTREKVERVLLVHRQESINAIKERMNNKKNWETENGAPFSELAYLLAKLETQTE